MECTICKNGTTQLGIVTVTFERGGNIVIIKDVPAQVCNNCAHYYLSENIAQKVFDVANESIERGSEIEVIRLNRAS